MLYFETKHPNETDYISVEHFFDFEFGLHLHQHFEIMYVSEGELSAQIDDRFYTISKGNICFVMPMQAHAYSTSNRSECTVCVFSPTFLPDFYEKYKYLYPDCPIMDFNCYADFFDTLENKESNRYALQAGFYSVIALLVKNTEFKDRNEKLHSFIEASIDYLDKNFDKEPNISSLARMLGYDAHYCSCLFNKTYGKNFPTMINEYRIAKAQHLLQAGRLSMTEIAESCGFNCIRSFNRNFLKVTGCAPREFIKR